MTREEAIEILETARKMYPGKSVIRDAFTLAISALTPPTQEQLEQVWPGCDRCKDPDTAIAWERWGHQYCSQCGRPLTPDAQAKRLKSLID